MKIKYSFIFFISIITQLIFSPIIEAQSAIHQLELLVGQTIDRSKNADGYNNNYTNTPAVPIMTMDDYDNEFTDFLTVQSNKENQKAIKCYNDKDWAKAISHFKKALKLNPDNTSYSAHLAYANDQLVRENEKTKKPINTNKKTDDVFLKNINQNIDVYKNQLKILRKPLMSYVPPIGTPRRIIEDGLMLGLFSTQKGFWVDQKTPNNPYVEKDNIDDPFSKKAFKEGEYYAGTDKSTNLELLRGFIDNASIGKYTLNSAYGKELVSKLSGTHFNRLMAHSNGATISEALIREDIITVDELNILGGDRSLMNFSGYDDLVKQPNPATSDPKWGTPPDDEDIPF